MKIVLNCCSKPSLFKQNGMPLFKGAEAKKAEAKAETTVELKPQPKADTVELSSKTEKAPKAEAKEVKAEQKTEPKTEAKAEAKCEGDACKK